MQQWQEAQLKDETPRNAGCTSNAGAAGTANGPAAAGPTAPSAAAACASVDLGVADKPQVSGRFWADLVDSSTGDGGSASEDDDCVARELLLWVCKRSPTKPRHAVLQICGSEPLCVGLCLLEFAPPHNPSTSLSQACA